MDNNEWSLNLNYHLHLNYHLFVINTQGQVSACRPGRANISSLKTWLRLTSGESEKDKRRRGKGRQGKAKQGKAKAKAIGNSVFTKKGWTKRKRPVWRRGKFRSDS